MCAQVVLAIAALGVAGFAATGAQGTIPGKNGRIVFQRHDSNRTYQLWIAGPGGRNTRQLTSGPARNGWGVWSPDGALIAFDSNLADPDRSDSTEVNDVYSMRPDGSAVTKLTDSSGFSADAAWSPDGKLIAFDSDRGDYPAQEGIYVINADGSDVRRITTLPASATNDLAPRFSPDGTHLAFTRYRGKGDQEKAALFTVRLDGSGLRRLTSFALHVEDADWSPDGTRLVFHAQPRVDTLGDIYVVRANGRTIRNLTHNPVGMTGSDDPVWSPDGTKVLFLDNRWVRGVFRTGLATMKPDGSARRFLVSKANGDADFHQPDWESLR